MTAKYSVKDLEHIPADARLIASNLLIANELHDIAQSLRELLNQQ
ncbi:hypothetical protein [Cerasicoccus maritimus]|nr:hypothetical protein [Cerasicoccus maritimus]